MNKLHSNKEKGECTHHPSNPNSNSLKNSTHVHLSRR